MGVRKPAAIGFYPASKSELLKTIENCFLHKLGPGKLPQQEKSVDKTKVIGGISPHAGYIYSGPIAAHLYYELSKLTPPETIVLLGPSHAGYAGAALMEEGVWETPLGRVEIDTKVASTIRSIAGKDERGKHYIVKDDWPHLSEHSLEVQIPFLQYIYGDNFRIVPVTFGDIPLNRCLELGSRFAKAVKKDETIIIASTDMTHYGSLYYGFSPVGDTDIDKITGWMNRADGGIIEAVKTLDAEKAYSLARKTTMCGYVPVTIITSASKALDISSCRLLKYATSYDVRGSRDAIVGYASMLFSL